MDPAPTPPGRRTTVRLPVMPLAILALATLLLAGRSPLQADEPTLKTDLHAESRFINEAYGPEFRARVNKAIDEGVRWLKARQQPDGTWQASYGRSYPMGVTALATLTLLKGGVPADDPSVRKAFAALRQMPMQRTYSVGLLLMALDARYAPARDPFVVEEVDRYGRRTKKDPCAENISKADLAWMRKGVAWLCAQQNANGVWRYPSGEDWDLSNTQYALLGLGAATRCNVKVRRSVWHAALTYLLNHQEAHGAPVLYKANEVRGRYRFEWREGSLARGFRYKENSAVTGSMTTAGLAGLIICQQALWSSRTFRGDKRAETRKGIRDAMAWMQEYFSVETNPVEPPPDDKGRPGAPRGHRGGAWHYYYLYGLERAGMLGRIRHFGGIDWYRQGAERILEDQGRRWMRGQSLSDTCFAILFLKRATTQMHQPVITPRAKAPTPAK